MINNNMQDFIRCVLTHIDPYQSRTLAHTCASMRTLALEHMRASVFVSVRVPDPIGIKIASVIKLSPVDSMLARSSLTSVLGAIDGTCIYARSCTHPAIVHWFGTLWQKDDDKNQRYIPLRAMCRYDDVEFVRVIFLYILSIEHYDFTNDDNNMYRHPWYIWMRASIPKSLEISRVMRGCASNQTQSMGVFMFLMSRNVTDFIKHTTNGESSSAALVCKTILIEAIIADNRRLARVMIDAIVSNFPSQEDILEIKLNYGIVTSGMVQFCKDNNITIVLSARCVCLNKEALIVSMHKDARDDEYTEITAALTIVAMNIRESELIQSLISRRKEFDGWIHCLDIIYICCCADRMDVATVLVAQRSMGIQIGVYEFDPYALARVRNLAIAQMHNTPSCVASATQFILTNSRTIDQARALLPPCVMTLFMPIIHIHHNDVTMSMFIRMYNIWRDITMFVSDMDWFNVLRLILYGCNIDGIEQIARSLPNITGTELSICMRDIIDYRPCSIWSRPDFLDRDRTHRYLISRLDSRSKTKSRDKFMLGLLFISREIMCESRYKLCADDCTMTISYYAMAYMCANPSVSEFFLPSERLACYLELIRRVDQNCQSILLRELSVSERAEVLKHEIEQQRYINDCKVNSIELIVTALSRANAGV
ncbi:MAG: hypothetical protein WC440_05720 [Candidatus Omnitrophota bacterium]